MAVGSWSRTPLFPGLSTISGIIEQGMERQQDNTLKELGTDSEDLDSDSNSDLEKALGALNLNR